MRKLILATHGSLAEGMYSAAKMILGECNEICAYGLDTYKNPIDIYEIIEVQVAENQMDEFIILCDINGGSVHNQLMHLCKYENVYLVTGMTLSLVLELSLAREDIENDKLLETTVNNAKDNMLIFNHHRVQKEIDRGIEDDKLW